MRFPEFSGEWEKYRNETLFQTISEKNKDKSITTILSASQQQGMVERDSLGLDIKFDYDSISSYKIVRKGDYVIHLRSFQGGFAFSEQIGVCSPAYTILRPSPVISYGFLKYHFVSNKFIDALRIVTYGIRDGRSISVEEWLKLYTSLPKTEEQNKIIQFLNFIEKRIETQIRVIEDLQSLKKAIIERSYNVGGDVHKIGELVEQVSERNKSNNYPVLSVNNRLGFVEQADQFEDRTVASEDTSNYKVVSTNDFAYNPARINVGSIARLKDRANGIVSPMYVCFRTRSNILPDYFEFFFDTTYFKHEMFKRLEGSVRLCLSYEGLCNISMSVPSIDEQKKLSNRLSVIEQKIQLESKILEAYRQQKMYLLQAMFI